jgi:hypothetical protein
MRILMLGLDAAGKTSNSPFPSRKSKRVTFSLFSYFARLYVLLSEFLHFANGNLVFSYLVQIKVESTVCLPIPLSR